jgi:hypothetical protein
MCPPTKACEHYEPDYERSESDCYGFGYTPPCKFCGRNEMAHSVRNLLDDDEFTQLLRRS